MEGYVTVEQMMKFREMKVMMQEELLRSHPGSVVVAFGMNIPGPKKTDEEILIAFEAGVDALRETFRREGIHIVGQRSLTVQAGYVMFYALSCPGASYVKKITVQLEETHLLGRLFDIDVFWPDGNGISREVLGLPKRTCFICDQEAKICGRSRAHRVEELQKRVHEMILSWIEGQSAQTAQPVPFQKLTAASEGREDKDGGNVQRIMQRSRVWQDSMRHNYAAQGGVIWIWTTVKERADGEPFERSSAV